ncbi:hypothetical protein AQS8620_00243 [Aquimixticola soesokkakensis]|uniref:Ribbon-helix-helix protein CopG domain-containing protein n=1 Tax=Aquimixticola soesokkakensis TaxID=1519096 RepID=A0A1Y5RH79_9RHOB|nr:hypothetical protein [Aquimixticola soesokkakensis]SLN14787.1 hypothetical protein AQS8620_00243 [Aquimixticola soesokkakensis]
MEKITLYLDESTVQMLHLLARDSGQTIGKIVQEAALDRYMRRAVEGLHSSAASAPYLDLDDSEFASG